MVMSWLAWALVLVGLVLAGLAVAGVLGSQAVRLAASQGLRRVANSAGLLTAPAVRRRIRLRRWTYAALGGVVAVALVAAAGIGPCTARCATTSWPTATLCSAWTCRSP